MLKPMLNVTVNYIPYGLRRYIRLIPGIAALQRILIKRFLSGRSFVHMLNAGPAAGLRFEITLPFDKLIWTATYEYDFARALGTSIQQGDICYDIGGYRGYMSGVMAASGASRVVVFEPLPVNQKALRRLCELNPALPIEIVPLAVGNFDGSMRLKVMPETSMAKLANSPFQPEASSVEEIDVRICQLDSLLSQGQLPAPNVIKIDVEGGEFEVLQGAHDTLQKYKPRVFLEAHSAALEDACSHELLKTGYQILRAGPRNNKDDYPCHLIASSC
jgi:FkbM family methyltransferase